MRPHLLVMLAVIGEATLVVIAVVWARLRDISILSGSVVLGVTVGLFAASVLGLANWYLLCRAPDVAGIVAIRRLYQRSLKPVFGRISRWDVMIISVAAGVGEELLFRGVLQPEWGLVPASLIFGVLHMGGSGTLVFGFWVAIMGGALGSLATWTDGLLAPIIAHTAYDAAALTYIRWDFRRVES
jgi:hypothetical protein